MPLVSDRRMGKTMSVCNIACLLTLQSYWNIWIVWIYQYYCDDASVMKVKIQMHYALWMNQSIKFKIICLTMCFIQQLSVKLTWLHVAWCLNMRFMAFLVMNEEITEVPFFHNRYQIQVSHLNFALIQYLSTRVSTNYIWICNHYFFVHLIKIYLCDIILKFRR